MGGPLFYARRDDAELMELLAERVTELRLAVNVALIELKRGPEGLMTARWALERVADPWVDLSPAPQASSGQTSKGLTTAEVAAMLGVAQRTVGVYVKRGKLHPWLTARGYRRFDRAEVEQLCAQYHIRLPD